MSYFTSAEHAALIADPNYIATLYANNRSRFIADLGSHFSAEIEEMIKAGFCGIAAYDLKPYGSSTPSSMADLLAASVLQCSGYAILAHRFFILLVPMPTITTNFIGFNGGAVSNHVQIFAHKAPDVHGNNGGDWLIDPTVGMLLCGHDASYVVGGRGPCVMAYSKDFYWRTDIAAFHTQMVAALTGGLYRASSLLYWTTDFDKFIAPPPQSDWMTPQA